MLSGMDAFFLSFRNGQVGGPAGRLLLHGMDKKEEVI